MLAIQGRFTMCVADGICFICFCESYGGCILLRVTGCRATRKAGCLPDPGWSVLRHVLHHTQVNHMQRKGFFSPCPGSPITQERALQSTRHQRLRVRGLNKQCPDPCSSEAIGQRSPEKLLQSRHLLTCWTKMESS